MATPYSKARTGGRAANTTRISLDAGATVRSMAGVTRCRRKFLRFFPKGFHDQKYVDWEREYKWEAHERWQETLDRDAFRKLLRAGAFDEIAAHAVRVEARTNLIFSFEKMALRDAVRPPQGARLFAAGLHDFLYGGGSHEERFVRWGEVLAALPRPKTRVHTWPVQTVFGFIARPDREIFLKPNVTRRAAEAYGVPFDYSTRPGWKTYAELLAFAQRIAQDLADLEPRDLIDIQSFIWVQGSDEY